MGEWRGQSIVTVETFSTQHQSIVSVCEGTYHIAGLDFTCKPSYSVTSDILRQEKGERGASSGISSY